MRIRLLAVVLICGSFVTGAANAQRGPIRQLLLQDDETGSLFSLSLKGAYAYVGCDNNIKLEGGGTVKLSGCMVTFETDARSPLVQAEIDLCKGSGRASILMNERGSAAEDVDAFLLTVIDSDMSNNTAQCR
jgi:hypothetical protein